jgi:hypothetical protein
MTKFSELADADLVVNQLYESGSTKTLADEPISKLMPVGNMGGFRIAKRPGAAMPHLVVLFSTGEEIEWPDEIDWQSGRFTYWGDNREGSQDIDKTKPGGNRLLASTFRLLHSNPRHRDQIPPFFLFEKGVKNRDVIFRGLLVPGAIELEEGEDLVAVWRSRGKDVFQNYRATFTILDAARIDRRWIKAISSGDFSTEYAPTEWKQWVRTGSARALKAAPVRSWRTKVEQLPQSAADHALLDTLYSHFHEDPHLFEKFALHVWQADLHGSSGEVTRKSRDGGFDAFGDLAVGPASDRISLGWVLEAKCYRPGYSVGVKQVMRIISRVRPRMFGAIITTSYVDRQAYEEIRADGHPIAIYAGADLVKYLRGIGLGDQATLKTALYADYPVG